MSSVKQKKTDSGHSLKEEAARDGLVLFCCFFFFIWLVYSSTAISSTKIPAKQNLIITSKHSGPGVEEKKMLALAAPGVLSSLTEYSFSPFFFAPILINYCDKELLMTINGIGPGLALNILETREKIGGFTSKKDMLLVNGIGKIRLRRLAPCFSFRKRQ